MEKKHRIVKRIVDSNHVVSKSNVASESQYKKSLKTMETEKKNVKEKGSTQLKSSNTLLSTGPKKSGLKSSQGSTIKDNKSVKKLIPSTTSKVTNVTNPLSKTNKNVVQTSSKTENRSVKPVATSVKKNSSNSSESAYNKFHSDDVKTGAKSSFTNVTVRSPKREHTVEKEQFREKNSFDESSNIENTSIAHKRSRTRTLEPNEVKVLKLVESKKNNESKIEKYSNVIKKDDLKLSVAKPEAFYVPLDEVFKKPNEGNNKTLTESDSDAMSYDEDFASYESDFESFASSEKHSDTDKSSLHEDLTENDNKRQTLEINDNINSLDEAPLDSGNYELKLENSDMKADECKADLEYDKIPYTFLKTGDVDLAKMPLYSDEGFDENSGGFSSASNSATAKFDEVVVNMKDESVLEALKHARRFKQKLTYYQKRAQDLSSLITFDNLEYSLFEMNPIPYDVFIKTFGKSNVIQRSCQTNDDYIEDFTQTSVIDKQNKWCQFPVNCSNFDIVSKNADKHFKRNSAFGIYSDSNLVEKQNAETRISIVSIQNPMEVFKKQRLGCSIDVEIDKVSRVASLYADQKEYERLYTFVEKIGKQMITYLKQTSSLPQDSGLKVVHSDYQFSASYTTPLSCLSSTLKYLKNRPPTMTSVCSNNMDLLLTVHPSSGKVSDLNVCDMIFSRTIVCIWDRSSDTLTEPAMVLLSLDNISCCKFYVGLAGFVIAGTEDGITCAWDLDEHDMWHKRIKDTIESIAGTTFPEKSLQSNIDSLVLRCCTFSSFSIDLKEFSPDHYGSIVEISTNEHLKDLTTKNQHEDRFNQVFVLQEYGLLTIWTVIKSKSTLLKSVSDINDHTSQSYWSNMKFYKHMVINLQESFRHMSILNRSRLNESFVKKSSSFQEFPLSNVQRKNSYKRTMTPRGDNADDISRTNKTLSFNQEPNKENSSSDLPVSQWESKLKCLTLEIKFECHEADDILVACSSGWIMHYEHRGNLRHPQIYECSGSTSLIRCLEICHHNPSYFLAGCDNCVDLFCLSNPRPLKSFFNEKGIENVGKYIRDSLIRIEWSKLRPCLFFTLSNTGCLTVWDLLKSDLMPIISEVLKKGNDHVVAMELLLDEKQVPNKEYLILQYSSGIVEKHDLLNELSSSVHQNKNTEAMVLGRYMQLL